MSHYDAAPLFLTTPPQPPNTCTGSAAPTGLNKCVTIINPGLAPWAMQEYRPVGAHCPTATINPTNNTITIKQIQKHDQMQQSIYTPQTHLTNTTPQTPNPTMSPERATLLHSPGWNEGEARYETLGKQQTIRQRALQGRHSCIAQGEMRAKPDMKPWVNSKQSDKEP